MEEGTESEQISDNFTCAVCLDVLYKPIVLVCGHVSCFWCCQHSMRMTSESHCPLCRHPYHHFPAICQTLHFLLKKLYPISYNRRNIQTREDEKQSTLGFSPDIDNLVTSKEPNHSNNVGQSSKISIEDDFSRTCHQVSVSDVLCVACKQLLFRPVVLNCGHVYCETCITIPTEGRMLTCQVCECRHPSGLPNICRELDRFIEEQFSSEYALRKNTIQLNQEQTQNRNTPNEASGQFPKLSFPTSENFLQWWTSHGSKFHNGVGCDMCGMCPIVGDRYRCSDCTEKSGYDLCGDCHSHSHSHSHSQTTGSNLSGRFGQKHTPQHHLKLVKPVINRNIIYRLLSGQLAVVSSRNQSGSANTSPEVPSPSLDGGGLTESPSEREDQNDNHTPV